MAPHSSTLAWRIPWMEEPGGLQSMVSLRVGHDRATSLSLFTFMHWRRKWQPTPVFLPGESRGRGSLVAAVYGVAQSRTRLKRRSSSSSSSRCHRQLLDIGENLHILGGQSEVSFVSSEGDNRRGTAVGGKNRYFSSFRWQWWWVLWRKHTRERNEGLLKGGPPKRRHLEACETGMGQMKGKRSRRTERQVRSGECSWNGEKARVGGGCVSGEGCQMMGRGQQRPDPAGHWGLTLYRLSSWPFLS